MTCMPSKPRDTDPSSPSKALSLGINEVFHSIQGESTRAGEPCVFVRLAGCHLRCNYCDTEYAFTEGTRRDLEDVLQEVLDFDTSLVEITGGEPLLQSAVHELERKLLEAGRTVLIETSGACDISLCDERSVVIMDIKTPSSGEQDRLIQSNIEHLRPHHEVKFVIGDRADYEFSSSLIREHHLQERVKCVLMSPVFQQPAGLHIAGQPGLLPRTLAEWILADRLPVRLQLQLHKFIWDPRMHGV